MPEIDSDRRVPSKMIALLLFISCAGAAACAMADNAPGEAASVTVAQVSANRDAYVGKTISIRGRIVLEELLSAGAGPCTPATGVGCNPVALTRLHVVDPDALDQSAARIDLYRRTSTGFEPYACTILGPGSYDCGAYKPGTVTVVDGLFTKYAQPVQQVIQPDGTTTVIRSEDVYILVVP